MPSTQDVRWRIDGIDVEGVVSEQPTWTIGDSITMEFVATDESIDGRPTQEPSYEFTLGGDLGATMGDPDPGTLNTDVFIVEGGVRDREDVYFSIEDTPFGELQRLTRYAGSATTGVSVDGVPLVHETIPARSERETFIVKIEPVGKDVRWAAGAWVLITDATDTSVVADVDAWLSIEIEATVLAPLTEYDSREELEDDMAPPVLPD